MAQAAVNFGSLLSMPAGEAKKPEALEVGNYPGIVKAYEYGSNNKNQTPYVRFAIGLLGWPDDVEPMEGVDLAKRTLRRDFYLTSDAFWRLDELMKSCDIALSGRAYSETIPDMIGKQVVVEVLTYMTKENEAANQVGKLTAAE